MSGMFSSSEQNGYDGYEYAFVRIGNSDEPEYIVGQVRKTRFFNFLKFPVVICACVCTLYSCAINQTSQKFGVGTF